MNAEQTRLKDNAWKKWALCKRPPMGTVREDYSANGDAWNYITHDMARSKAYRWSEEGIAGICDDNNTCVLPWPYGIKKTRLSKSVILACQIPRVSW